MTHDTLSWHDMTFALLIIAMSGKAWQPGSCKIRAGSFGDAQRKWESSNCHRDAEAAEQQFADWEGYWGRGSEPPGGWTWTMWRTAHRTPDMSQHEHEHLNISAPFQVSSLTARAANTQNQQLALIQEENKKLISEKTVLQTQVIAPLFCLH